MIIPLIVILIIFLIYLTNKKAKVKIDTTKHSVIRISVLIVAIPLIILILYITDGRNGMLGAFYGSYYFFGVWLFYLLVESISLYVTKQNKLARTSLLLFIISACIVCIGTFAFFNNLH